MEIKGTIKKIGEVVAVGTGGFTKRELVITTDEQYPQFICIEFHKDKTDLLNSLSIGQEVTAHINLRGREWTSPQGDVKYFNTIQGWKIDAETKAKPDYSNTAGIKVEEDGDLPFQVMDEIIIKQIRFRGAFLNVC